MSRIEALMSSKTVIRSALMLAGVSLPLAVVQTAPAFAAGASITAAEIQVRYLSATIDGIQIAYREAGRADAPAILLLHGFPTSSHMFRNLIPALADRYRVIAPDYPGFGQSEAPARSQFNYTFDNFAELIDSLTEKLGISRYALYVMDYGAPVGFRLAAQHPDRVTALVVQNGNAYREGLQKFWEPIQKYWASASKADREAIRWLTSLKATKWQYTHGVPDTSLVSPARGRTIRRSSTGRATRRSSLISSTTTEPMFLTIPSGRPISELTSRPRS
jgi:pimeloyl-ACP methyl ester carboxylesterase